MQIVNSLWPFSQVVIGLLLYRLCNKFISKMGGINSLVLMPVAPLLSLVLYAVTRIEKREYYVGMGLGLMGIPIILCAKGLGVGIIYISMFVTVVVYMFNHKQDGLGPVMVGLLICWMCKDVANPITVIICANMLADYILVRGLKGLTNKYKLVKDSYDNEGTLGVFISGIMEALLIGAPSDVTSNNKHMMDGISDVLCITNMLVNSSMRGSTTVVVTGLLETVVFFSVVIIMYYNNNIDYVNEWDKVWPPQYNSDVISIANWQLVLVVISLITSGTLDTVNTVLILVLCTVGSLFVRVKVTTSLFFTAKLLF